MRYKSLPRDSDIDPKVALFQGALALDAAAETAEKINDVEGLLNVAAMWMKFSEQIEGFAEKVEETAEEAELKAREGEIVKATANKIEMGFCLPSPEADPITVEEEEDGRVAPEE